MGGEKNPSLLISGDGGYQGKLEFRSPDKTKWLHGPFILQVAQNGRMEKVRKVPLNKQAATDMMEASPLSPDKPKKPPTHSYTAYYKRQRKLARKARGERITADAQRAYAARYPSSVASQSRGPSRAASPAAASMTSMGSMEGSYVSGVGSQLSQSPMGSRPSMSTRGSMRSQGSYGSRVVIEEITTAVRRTDTPVGK